MNRKARALSTVTCMLSVWAFLWGCSSKPDAQFSANPSGGSGAVNGGGALSNMAGAGASNGGASMAGASTAGGVAAAGAPSGGIASGGVATAGSGGGAPLECLNSPNLALDGGWIGCDPASVEDNPMGLQGSIYMYHDGSTCTSPVDACGAAGCCIKGATVVDKTFAKWGCGLGFELDSSGGATPVKKAYAGAAKCFDMKLTGSSGGNPVRIAYTQSDMMDGKVAPFLELKPLTNGFSGTVCFNDVTCPTEWMPPPNCMLGGPYDLQIQIVGGSTAGAFDLCLTELIPHETGGGLTSLGQVCGIVGENDKEHLTAGPYRIQNNVATANNGAECITARAGGGSAAFTVDSSTLSTSGSSPVAFPSIAYGWHFGQVTTGTGLPKALGAITAAPGSVAFTVPAGAGKYNASYDIWAMPASAGNDPTTPAGGVEVMIWLAAGGGPTPIGGPGETVNIDGHDFQIWSGTNSTWEVVTFWAKDYIPGWTDQKLKPFLDKVVKLGKAKDDWNLHSIEFGFEIWNGAPGFAVTTFKQAVN